jgi:DNA-directed RNA polymerase subunit RPC12/RpoP
MNKTHLVLGCCGKAAEVVESDDGATLTWKCPNCGSGVVTKRHVLGKDKEGDK